MFEYVTKDNIRRRIDISPDNEVYKTLMKWVDLLPTEDVSPIVHAKIIVADDGYVRCMACNKAIRYPLVSFSDIDYCPKCGAKMDAKEK